MQTRQHDSRTAFLDAGLREVRTRGYEATTVDDLCAATGLTKGSFFHHFKGKQEFVLAAAGHFAAMADGLFAQAPYRALADPRERLLGYVDFRASLLHGELADFTCLLGTLVQETYASHPPIRKACERHLSAHVDELVRDITEAKRRYAPRAKWTPHSLGEFIQATIQGAFVLAKAKHGPQVAIDCLAHLKRYLQSLFPVITTRKGD
jgi:TetR/AcrR family transcriptional repressor of nem operon